MNKLQRFLTSTSTNKSFSLVTETENLNKGIHQRLILDSFVCFSFVLKKKPKEQKN